MATTRPREPEFRVGDLVRTPTGRLAQVRGLVGYRLALAYVSSGGAERGQVNLLPELCTKVSP